MIKKKKKKKKKKKMMMMMMIYYARGRSAYRAPILITKSMLTNLSYYHNRFTKVRQSIGHNSSLRKGGQGCRP